MNAKQRKEIQKVVSGIGGVDSESILMMPDTPEGVDKWAQVAVLLDDAKVQIETIRDEETEKYDNMPEGLQSSERGDTMQEGISALDNAIQSLEDAINCATDDDSTDDSRAEYIAGAIEETVGHLDEVG